MVGLPRRHQNSVPIWVEVTVASRVGQSASGSDWKRGQQQARDFAPRLSFEGSFDFRFAIDDLSQLKIRSQKSKMNR
jgi:hypothetical protein